MRTEEERLKIEHSLLMISDILCVIICYFAAIFTRGIWGSVKNKPEYYMLVLLFALILCLLSHLFLDLSGRFSERSALAEFFYVTKYDLFMGATIGMVLFLTQYAQDFSRLAYIYFLIYQLILVFVFHQVLKRLLTKTYMRSSHSGKMVILVPEDKKDELLSELKTKGAWPHEITAAVPTTEMLYETIEKSVVDEVFIADPGIDESELSLLVNRLEISGIVAHVAVDPAEHIRNRAAMEEIAGKHVLTYRPAGEDLHRSIVKRITDIFGSLIGMLITIILFPFIALAIIMDSGRPVLYSQVRIGKNGREFKLWKFRSMRQDADELKEKLSGNNLMNGPVFKIKDDPRITKVGAFLRKTSLDELPQFFQVFTGRMSLIGTRPPTPEEYGRYRLADRRRISIKPGMTGLWQISGRNEITDFEEILKLDLQYIDNWSFGMDIMILIKTFWVVASRKGAL